METTFSMFSPQASRNMPQSLAFGTPEPESVALTEKYRPQRLAEMYGQSYAVQYLQNFADRPYPQAFIFSGDTGIGKSTASRALARELGINPDCLWQFDELQSGDLTDEYVERSLKDLRRCAPNGGWKMLLIEEADGLSHKARQRFLSCLETIPARTVIVFTTNHESKLDQRFLDRCERIRFESKADTLMADAQRFIDTMWLAEAMPANAPDVRTLPELVEGGNISFRRIVRYVESRKRRMPVATMAPLAPTPIEKKHASAMAEPIHVATHNKHASDDDAPPSPKSVKSAGVDPDSLDWPSIARRFQAGESQKRLAVEIGVSHGCVFSRLKKMGTTRPE